MQDAEIAALSGWLSAVATMPDVSVPGADTTSCAALIGLHNLTHLALVGQRKFGTKCRLNMLTRPLPLTRADEPRFMHKDIHSCPWVSANRDFFWQVGHLDGGLQNRSQLVPRLRREIVQTVAAKKGIGQPVYSVLDIEYPTGRPRLDRIGRSGFNGLTPTGNISANDRDIVDQACRKTVLRHRYLHKTPQCAARTPATVALVPAIPAKRANRGCHHGQRRIALGASQSFRPA